MAVSRMVKVVVAGSLSELSSFMRELQHAAVLHVTSIIKKDEQDSGPSTAAPTEIFSSSGYRELLDAKEFLDRFRKEESFWTSFFAPMRTVRRERFYSEVDSFSPGEVLRKTDELKQRVEHLHEERNRLTEINFELEPWKEIFTQLIGAGESAESLTVAGITSTDDIPLIENTPGIDLQVLGKTKDKTAIIIACHVSDREVPGNLLQRGIIERLDLSVVDGSPGDTYNRNISRLDEIDRELAEAGSEGEKLLEESENLLLALEHMGNMERAENAFRRWITTGYSFIASGWIIGSNLEKLKSITGNFEAVEFDVVSPEESEKPPVALNNRALFSPFQLITRLYSYPAYGSYDPSAVTSIFFAVFFGICLTDAGYGLLLALLSLWGLKKTGWRSDILWIAFWGGLFTIVAGLLTGGIFGDLFRRENPFIYLPALHSFREFFLWFDPMGEPMAFFRLVLFLGVIHIITGLVIGVISGLMQGDWQGALFDNMTWLVIMVSLLSVLFASDLSVRMALVSSAEPLLDSAVILPAFYAAGTAGLFVVLFGGRGEESLFFRFFIGFLKLLVLSGVFSYLGDVLSYIRLMALGMVTAGIATAINTIAFMMSGIPVAGYLLTAVVLVGGHIFNLAINALGGFVHTLRLQYVEFYSKFFTGGGVPFEPLSLNNRYVKIID
ncbi:MAG TPA: V-type ATPase 116kDa subunit family protein [Spirochaetota bacterium]|nr:V-type ATPase 116kDa subunit family protein [Spirochaetota bacterium]